MKFFEQFIYVMGLFIRVLNDFFKLKATEYLAAETGVEVVRVGIHVRRTDYINWVQNRYKV